MNKFKAIIDTIAIKTDINNVYDFTRINNENFDYIEKLADNFENSKMAIKVNLHTRYGEMTLDSLKKYNGAIAESLAEVGVMNLNLFNF